MVNNFKTPQKRSHMTCASASKYNRTTTTDNSCEYNPHLYIKSGFTPTKESDYVELEINNFVGDYKNYFNTHLNPTRNLTFYQ
jgi:hypothetical protein